MHREISTAGKYVEPITGGSTSVYIYPPWKPSETGTHPAPRTPTTAAPTTAETALGVLAQAIAAQERQDRLCRLLACHPDALEGKVAELLQAQQSLMNLARVLREVIRP